MKRRIEVGIVLAKYPPHSAGHQLSVLHWLVGFRESGWDVWIVEKVLGRLGVGVGRCAEETLATAGSPGV